jgi:hypothetical protein
MVKERTDDMLDHGYTQKFMTASSFLIGFFFAHRTIDSVVEMWGAG